MPSTRKHPTTASPSGTNWIPTTEELGPLHPWEVIFEGAKIRIVQQAGDPWFVAADVCTILQHTNTTMALKGMEPDWKMKAPLRMGNVARIVDLVSEAGLYELILTSRMPKARPFKRWVLAEVLPQLRRHGRYDPSSDHDAKDTKRLTSDRHMVEVHPADPKRAAGLYGEYQPITLTLPGAGRYIIDALPGRDPGVRLVPLEDLGDWILAEEIRTDGIILSALLQQIHGMWRKFRLIDTLDVGARQIALAEVDKAIVQGGTVAARFSSILLDQTLKATAAPAHAD